MSLRLRLLVALVSLVLIGLLVADAATYISLRSFLIKRVDQQLVAAERSVASVLIAAANSPLPSFPGTLQRADTTLPPGTYGEIIDQSARTVIERVFTYGGKTPPAPLLPSGLVQNTDRQQVVLASVAASGQTSLRYRLLAVSFPDSVYTLVVAIPLTEVTQTLGRLMLIEALVSAIILLGLASLAWWIVRREMRPLEDMARTAGAIAAGDLSQRVERAESRSEVGRLGLALNAMLAQIEEAFAKRTASEDKLRRFLAQASHELRTPLASVRGYAELFRRGAKDRPDDLALAMRRIEQEAARMGVLVEEMLLLSRLDEGRPLERDPVDLAQVAADAVADARITAPDRSITLDAPEPVVVLGDEARLRQLATNLVSNALRHAGSAAHIRVGAHASDDRAVLTVQDDGVGIAEDETKRVFEPFYRLADGEADGADGAGLGLSIVAAVAASHGGHVDLETSPGQGALFTVELPLAHGDPDDDEGAEEECVSPDVSESATEERVSPDDDLGSKGRPGLAG
jgi:two-component system OmpR family sensor kinase